MKTSKILIPGVAATTLMTLFSYVLSKAEHKNFKEPELLRGLMEDKMPGKGLALPAGWITHYTMGISWATVFEVLFREAHVKRNLKNGLVLGALSGLTGIVIWRLAFKIHPNPPRTDYKRFYIQLLLAHLVYALTVTATGSDEVNRNNL
jgi:hypothetical protein